MWYFMSKAPGHAWNQNGVKEGILADFDDDEEQGQQPMANEQEEDIPTNQNPPTAESQSLNMFKKDQHG